MAADRKLTKLTLFWLALVIPAAGFIGAAFIIWVNSNLYTDYSYEGFNKATEVFRVPLSILLLALPLVALVATIHRSAQSSEALKRAAAQNTFANYYTHNKKFSNLLSPLEKDLKISFINPPGLYRKIFPENSSLSLDPVSSGVNSSEPLLTELAGRFLKVKQVSQELKLNGGQVDNFYKQSWFLSNQLHFSVNDGRPYDPSLPEQEIAYSEDKPHMHLCKVGEVLEKLRDFSHIKNSRTSPYHRVSDSFKGISDYKFNSIY